MANEIRITSETLEDLLAYLNRSFLSFFKEIRNIDTGAIEREDGTIVSVHTNYFNTHSLENFEAWLKEGVNKEINRLKNYDVIFLRQPWKTLIINPYHIDPYTFDLISPPVPGKFTLYAQYRCLNSNTGEFSDRGANDKREGQTSLNNFIKRTLYANK